jgi:HD-GYP domain-containing protein (c-di-GMP phosphodiesterase class II)
MRIAAVSRVPSGTRIARAVRSSRNGVCYPLLQAGAAIDEHIRAALLREGVFAVYVEDAASEGIEPPPPVLSEETRAEAMLELHKTFDLVATSGRTTRVPRQHVGRLSRVVEKILSDIGSSDSLLYSLSDLQAFDSYTLGHSMNVCVLGVMLGEQVLKAQGWKDAHGSLRRDHITERCESLGLGLLLHDIGKVVVPREVLAKPGALTEEEMAMVREHPEAGAHMIDHDSVSPLAGTVILQHHERIDGTGYPRGLAGDDVHQFASIASMADIYDAVCTNRVYRGRMPSHEAWELVLSLADRAFPIAMVRVFKKTVAPYPEGAPILLSDGRRGLVVKNWREHTTRPTVRVTHDEHGLVLAAPEELELSAALSLTIVDTLDDLPGPEGPDSLAEPLSAEQAALRRSVTRDLVVEGPEMGEALAPA